MKGQWAFVLLLVHLAQACQYYQLDAERVDFETFGEAYAAAAGNNLPIYVCDSAVLAADEDVPVISEAVSILGEDGAEYPFWKIEKEGTVFVVTADVVFVRGIQFVFKGTLFAVQDAGFLQIERADFWFGAIGVLVDTNGDPGTGFQADHAVFRDVGEAVVVADGYVWCADCDIINARDAGFVVRSFSKANRIAVNSTLFVDTPLKFGIQAVESGGVKSLDVSETITDQHAYIDCRTYPVNAAIANFGAAQQSCKKNEWTDRDVVFVIIAFLLIIGMFASATALIVVKRRNDVYNLSEKRKLLEKGSF